MIPNEFYTFLSVYTQLTASSLLIWGSLKMHHWAHRQDKIEYFEDKIHPQMYKNFQIIEV